MRALILLCVLATAASADIAVKKRYVVVQSSDEDWVMLEPVHFTGKSTAVPRTARKNLDEIAKMLLKHPTILLVEVQGHTDERGDEAANLDLSDARAAAVRDYLVAKGVEPHRLEAQGYGETQPQWKEHTAKAWAQNRRVEFLIIKTKTD